MKRNTLKAISIIAGVLFISLFVIELDAYARAGGGRSFGGRGSRSYSSPNRSNSGSSTSSSAARPQATPAPVQSAPFQQPGGFMRSMGGGILGGLLGGMLFSSLGHAGMGGFGGSGIGIFEIALILVIGFLIYRMVTRKKREESLAYQPAYKQGGYHADVPPAYGSGGQVFGGTASVADDGLPHIRQLDPSFDEGRFKDDVMDIFFRIQGAWTNRDLSAAAGLLTDEMRNALQEDVDKLLKERKVNRLENIAVRKVDITEAWQESGQDFITALVYANLLDYTTDDLTGQVVSGSKTEPVKFEEFWTVTRPAGGSSWRLSAINQA